MRAVQIDMSLRERRVHGEPKQVPGARLEDRPPWNFKSAQSVRDRFHRADFSFAASRAKENGANFCWHARRVA